jgi:hypothetical protein
LKQAIFRIMPFFAAWTNEIASPGRALVIVIFGHGKRHAATARNEEHAQPRFLFGNLLGLALPL